MIGNVMRALMIALCFTLLPLAACESPASDGGRDLARAVEGRTWIAEVIGGKDVVDGTKVTLKIEGGRVSGKGGCNAYGGPVEINRDTIKFGALFSTKMACMANGSMEQESRYLNMLQGATHGEVRSDGTLIISGNGGAIEFRAE